jgi:hypothetical protein
VKDKPQNRTPGHFWIDFLFWSSAGQKRKWQWQHIHVKLLA